MGEFLGGGTVRPQRPIEYWDVKNPHTEPLITSIQYEILITVGNIVVMLPKKLVIVILLVVADLTFADRLIIETEFGKVKHANTTHTHTHTHTQQWHNPHTIQNTGEGTAKGGEWSENQQLDGRAVRRISHGRLALEAGSFKQGNAIRKLIHAHWCCCSRPIRRNGVT